MHFCKQSQKSVKYLQWKDHFKSGIRLLTTRPTFPLPRGKSLLQLEPYFSWHLLQDPVWAANLALPALPPWTCPCSYNFCCTQWPTVIIVMYDRKGVALWLLTFPPSNTGQPSTSYPCSPPLYFCHPHWGKPPPVLMLHLVVGSMYAAARHTPLAPWMLMLGGEGRKGGERMI